ncbi:MAG: metal-dependent hydrolase [Candidatus Hodarchaeota archaeon]
MPDWITHIIVCWFLYQFLVKLEYITHDRHLEMLMLLGATLPDLNRTFLIGEFLRLFISFPIYDAYFIFHTSVGSILVAGIIVQFFDERKKSFGFILIGLVTHFALDSLLFSIAGGTMLFFPLTTAKIHLNLLYSDDMSYMFLALGVFVTIVAYRWRHKIDTDEHIQSVPEPSSQENL